MEKEDDHQHSPKRQKIQVEEDISKIEDLTYPITIDENMNTGIFWDVEDYPFLVGTHPDEMYEKIKSALDSNSKEEGLLSIWAYVDKNNKSWDEYLGNKKTWKSRLYFIPTVKDKDERAHRIFIDISLWKLDVLPYPVARLFVIADGVSSVNHFFYPMLQGLVRCEITTTLYTLPSKDHQPENPQWIQLCGDHWVECVLPPLVDLKPVSSDDYDTNI